MIRHPWRWVRQLRPGRAATDAERGDPDGPLLDEDLLRLINRLALQSNDALTEWLAGEHDGRRKAQAIEFADYRGYVLGDDFRLIDWNAYARLGELFVKTSLAPESITLSLLLDCNRSMDWGRPNRLRYAKRLAAALGAIALLRSDGVRLFALGDGSASAGPLLQGPGTLRTLVDEVERIGTSTGTDLPGSIEAYGRLIDPRGMIVVFSDLLVPMESIAALGKLVTDSTTATVLHVVDAGESLPSASGAVELRDSETGERVALTITPALRQRYARQFELRVKAIEARCAEQQVSYVRVPTSVPPAELLAGVLQRENLIQA